MALALQPDGKLIVGGRFDTVNGAYHPLIVRLNGDGSPDESFQTDTPFCGGWDDPQFVSALGLMPDDKLVAGGWFQTFNALPRVTLARLHLAKEACRGIVSFGAAEYLVSETNGIATVSVVRAGNTNLPLAVSYATHDVADRVETIYVTAVPGRDYVSQSGTLLFAPGERQKSISITLLDNLQVEPNRSVGLYLQPPADAVIGFPEVARIVILDDESAGKPGSLDLTFRPAIVPDLDYGRNTVAADSLGRILVAEPSDQYFTEGPSRLHRLNPDGSRDFSFDVPIDGWVYSMATDSSNRVLIAGQFMRVGGFLRIGVARLLADGSVDESFDAHMDSRVGGVLALPNGKIMISGMFNNVGGAPSAGLARLNEDGSVDPSFDSCSGVANDYPWYDYLPGPIATMGAQSDGKLLIGGDFTFVNGVSRRSLARLNVDGSLDEQFVPAIQPYTYLVQLIVQPDQKILLSTGVRLNADGSLDTTFRLPPNEFLGYIALQADGKILNGLKRFAADGSLDESFYTGSGAGGAVFTLVLPDGRILVTGFSRFNEVRCPGIAILNGGALRSSAGQFVFTVPAVSVDETNPAIDLLVRRELGTSGDATVSYATLDDQARAGVDYVAQAGLLLFTNGDTSAHTIRIPIIHDARATGDRRFTVALANPTGGALLGNPSRMTVQVLEDEVGVAFGAPEFWTGEPYSTAVQVRRIGPVSTSFSVWLDMNDGTAKAGEDYTPVPQALSFAPGETSKWIVIPVINDLLPEPDESVNLTLGNPVNAQLSTPNTATLWIADDDRGLCVVPRRSEHQLNLTLDTPPGSWFYLETSTNLVQWEFLTSFYRGHGDRPIQFQPDMINAPARFYRMTRP